MKPFSRLFRTGPVSQRTLGWGDLVILAGIAVLIYLGVRLALGAPESISGPTISSSPKRLPLYAVFSVTRMAAAYLLSLVFTLAYGSFAARSRRAEKVLLPLLDVLQSVPILSFLPVVLLALSAVLPQRIAAELACVILIFTSQAWNLTFAWYQSLTTVPRELREASTLFRMNRWMQFKTLEFPFATISLIWNSMMSWAGGWFFLMAAEIFTVGDRDFRLPGLGAYLREAANRGDLSGILWGLLSLVAVIVILDQLVWRPLLAWSDRFKLEMVESERAPTSWFFDALRASRLAAWVREAVFRPVAERIDQALLRRFPVTEAPPSRRRTSRRIVLYVLGGASGLALLYGAVRTGGMLAAVPGAQWAEVAMGVGATFLRVAVALAIALAWTVPVGVLIGTKPRTAAWLQPVVQVAASIPATALFPILLLGLTGLPGGLNLAAVLLMLMGTQWYLLFNIIAGASAIPQDLKYTASLLGLRRWQRWRTLTLPALFPYIVTGAIAAGGGAWNASIVAEYVDFGGKRLWTVGVGSLISRATAAGNYPLLLAATVSMIVTVALVNRWVWRRLYRIGAERYRLE